MAANTKAGRATSGKTGAARKVASPRKQAAAAEPAPEPTPVRRGRPAKAAAIAAAAPAAEPTPARRGRPTKTAPAAALKAAAGTRVARRTATAGAAARTAQPRRSRTAATAGVVVEPSEILGAQDRGSSAADQTQQASPGARNADGVIDHAEVEWRGRTWLVRLPTIEQMTIYRRLAKRFQALGEDQGKPDAAPVSMEEATAHFDRALKLITSILVTPADVVWIEDEMLEGRLQLADASELMRDAIERFGELNPMEQTGTRAERRALKTGKARLGD